MVEGKMVARERTSRVDRNLGRRFGNYRIVRLIGRGAMGLVYEAMDEVLLRPAAVKLIRWKQGPLDASDLVEGLLAEARHVARVRHPKVVQVYTAGRYEGETLIAMEMVRGPSADGLVRAEGPLSVERAVSIVRDVAEALQAAHDEGIIHRDVKPANVLLAPNGAKLSDFGMAISTRSAPTDSMIAGTPQYLSPECWLGQPASPQSDVYALAGTLYFLLTGHPPHRGRSVASIKTAHLRGKAPDVAKRRPDLPADIQALLRRGLAKDPKARFSSCEAFATELFESTVDPRTGPEVRRVGREKPVPRGPLETALSFERTPFGALEPGELIYSGAAFGSTVDALEVHLSSENGSFCVAGPAQSGRSTILQAALARLHPSHRCISVDLSGVTSGVGFWSALGAGLDSSTPGPEALARALERRMGSLDALSLVFDHVPAHLTPYVDRLIEVIPSTAASLLLTSESPPRRPERFASVFELAALDEGEIRDYLQAWLRATRSKRSSPVLITPDAVKVLMHRTHGLLGAVNRVALNALALLARRGRRVLTSLEVARASDEDSWIDPMGQWQAELPEITDTLPDDIARLVDDGRLSRRQVLEEKSC